jgi:hypothetical protein
MPKRPQITQDDLFLYIYEKGYVRTKDLEHAFVKTKQISRGTLYKYKRQLEDLGKIQSTPVHTHPLHYLFHVPKHHHREAELLKQFRIFPQSIFTSFTSIPWTEPPPGFYLTHVKEKILWQNEHTGAMMILTKTPVGIESPVHYHPDANQWNIGYHGAIETTNGTRQNLESTISFVPKGELHGTGKVVEKTLSLLYFDGPRTKKFPPVASNKLDSVK